MTATVVTTSAAMTQKKNACAMMEMNMEAFFDDYRILQLRVTIPVTFF